MNKKLLYLLVACLILLMSACGPAATPTLSVTEVAGTALSVAYTQLAATQAALPTATATAIPPTNTPLPLPTLPPPPTLAPVAATVALPTTASQDPCDGVPPAKPKGDTAQVRFVNKSKGQVNLSFGMYKANSQGECGIYSFALSIYDAPTVTVLAGCYWGYAWVTGKVPSIARSSNAMCVDANGLISVTIGAETIAAD